MEETNIQQGCRVFCGEKCARVKIDITPSISVRYACSSRFAADFLTVLILPSYRTSIILVVKAPLMERSVEDEASVCFCDSLKRHIAYDTRHMRLQISVVDVYDSVSVCVYERGKNSMSERVSIFNYIPRFQAVCSSGSLVVVPWQEFTSMTSVFWITQNRV